jgi:hypothetical protein
LAGDFWAKPPLLVRREIKPSPSSSSISLIVNIAVFVVSSTTSAADNLGIDAQAETREEELLVRGIDLLVLLCKPLLLRGEQKDRGGQISAQNRQRRPILGARDVST